MDIRTLTPRYSVSPQIMPEDLATLRAAGFTTVIANRPDGEIPPELQSAAMEKAARAVGLEFHYVPITRETMSAANMNLQRGIIDESAGPTFAYCASGTRSTIIWSLAMAGDMTADEILALTARAGYQLEEMRPTLEALARARN